MADKIYNIPEGIKSEDIKKIQRFIQVEEQYEKMKAVFDPIQNEFKTLLIEVANLSLAYKDDRMKDLEIAIRQGKILQRTVIIKQPYEVIKEVPTYVKVPQPVEIIKEVVKYVDREVVKYVDRIVGTPKPIKEKRIVDVDIEVPFELVDGNNNDTFNTLMQKRKLTPQWSTLSNTGTPNNPIWREQLYLDGKFFRCTGTQTAQIKTIQTCIRNYVIKNIELLFGITSEGLVFTGFTSEASQDENWEIDASDEDETSSSPDHMDSSDDSLRELKRNTDSFEAWRQIWREFNTDTDLRTQSTEYDGKVRKLPYHMRHLRQEYHGKIPFTLSDGSSSNLFHCQVIRRTQDVTNSFRIFDYPSGEVPLYLQSFELPYNSVNYRSEASEEEQYHFAEEEYPHLPRTYDISRVTKVGSWYEEYKKIPQFKVRNLADSAMEILNDLEAPEQFYQDFAKEDAHSEQIRRVKTERIKKFKNSFDTANHNTTSSRAFELQCLSTCQFMAKRGYTSNNVTKMPSHLYTQVMIQYIEGYGMHNFYQVMRLNKLHQHIYGTDLPKIDRIAKHPVPGPKQRKALVKIWESYLQKTTTMFTSEATDAMVSMMKSTILTSIRDPVVTAEIKTAANDITATLIETIVSKVKDIFNEYFQKYKTYLKVILAIVVIAVLLSFFSSAVVVAAGATILRTLGYVNDVFLHRSEGGDNDKRTFFVDDDDKITSEGNDEKSEVATFTIGSITHGIWEAFCGQTTVPQKFLKAIGQLTVDTSKITQFIQSCWKIVRAAINAISKFFFGVPFFDAERTAFEIMTSFDDFYDSYMDPTKNYPPWDNKRANEAVAKFVKLAVAEKKMAKSSLDPQQQRRIADLLARARSFIVGAYSYLQSAKGRQLPVWVNFCGPPDVGKSVCVRLILSAVRWQLRLPVLAYNEVYNRNCMDEFFSGYSNQWATIYDDLFQNKDVNVRGRVANELIGLRNDELYPCNMPGLEEKGTTFFSSPIIISTTNLVDRNMYTDMSLIAPSALFRRQDFDFYVTLKPGSYIKGVRPTPDDVRNWNFKLQYENDKETRPPVDMDFFKVVSLITERYKQYEAQFNSKNNSIATDWSKYLGTKPPPPPPPGPNGGGGGPPPPPSDPNDIPPAEDGVRVPLVPLEDRMNVVQRANVQIDSFKEAAQKAEVKVKSKWDEIVSYFKTTSGHDMSDEAIQKMADDEVPLDTVVVDTMRNYTNIIDTPTTELTTSSTAQTAATTQIQSQGLFDYFYLSSNSGKLFDPRRHPPKPLVHPHSRYGYCKYSEHGCLNHASCREVQQAVCTLYGDNAKSAFLAPTVCIMEQWAEFWEAVRCLPQQDMEIVDNWYLKYFNKPVTAMVVKKKLSIVPLTPFQQTKLKKDSLAEQHELPECTLFTGILPDEMRDHFTLEQSKSISKTLFDDDRLIRTYGDLSETFTDVKGCCRQITQVPEDDFNKHFSVSRILADQVSLVSTRRLWAKLKLAATVLALGGIITSVTLAIVGLYSHFRPAHSSFTSETADKLQTKTQRRVMHMQKRGPVPRKGIVSNAEKDAEECEETIIKSESDQNAEELGYQILGKNMYYAQFVGPKGLGHSFLTFWKGNIATAVLHMEALCGKISKVRIHAGHKTDDTFTEHEVQYIKTDPNRDLMFLRVMNFAFRPDITKHLRDKMLEGEVSVPMALSMTSEMGVVQLGTTIKPVMGTVVADKAVLKNSYFAYKMPGGMGECGRVVMVSNTHIDKKIMGVHVGSGNGASVVAPILTSDFIGLEIVSECALDNFVEGDIYTSYEKAPFSIDFTKRTEFVNGMKPIGKISRPTSTPQFTILRRSPLQSGFTIHQREEGGEVKIVHCPCPFQVTTAPAQLKKGLDKDGVEKDPVKLAYRKLANRKLKVAPKELFDSDVFDDCFPPNFSNYILKPLTIEEAAFGCPELGLPGIDSTTSSGYPFTAYGISRDTLIDKLTFFIDPEVRKEVAWRISQLMKGIVVPSLNTSCLKDETRPLDRVIDFASRAFQIGQLAHLLVCRMFFGAYMAQVEHDRESGIAVGINVYSVEWKMMYERLSAWGGEHMHDPDTSGWDQYYMFAVAKAFCLEFAKRTGYEVDSYYIKGLYYSFITSISGYIIVDSNVYFAMFMLSGSLVTSIGNCIFNCAKQRVIYKVAARHASILNPPPFSLNVHSQTFGDDLALGVNPDVAGWYNPETIAKFADVLFSHIHTNPDKSPISASFKKITEIKFLQRSFKNYHGAIIAPLEIDSINSMLLWIKKSKFVSQELQFRINCETALAEIALHGEPRFLIYQNIVNRCLIHNKLPVVTSSFQDYMARWLHLYEFQ